MLEEVHIKAKAKQWGNSLGIVIPKQQATMLNLKPGEEINLVAVKIKNPLKELFGTVKFDRPTEELIKETRKEMQWSKWDNDI